MKLCEQNSGVGFWGSAGLGAKKEEEEEEEAFPRAFPDQTKSHVP